MQKKMFTIHDSAADLYCDPFFFGNTGEALRAFIVALNDESSTYSKSPGDFTLFEIGEYDDSTALLTQSSIHTNLGNGVALKQRLRPLSEISQKDV